MEQNDERTAPAWAAHHACQARHLGSGSRCADYGGGGGEGHQVVAGLQVAGRAGRRRGILRQRGRPPLWLWRVLRHETHVLAF